MRSTLPFKKITLNPATVCLDSCVCTSARLEAPESILNLPVTCLCLPIPVQALAASQHVPQPCSQSADFPLYSQHPGCQPALE